MKTSSSKLPWIFFTIFLLLLLGFSVVLSNIRSKHQQAEALRTQGQQWQLGYDNALGKPAKNDWLKNQGVYFVRWSCSFLENSATNYVAVLEYMGTNITVAPPQTWGDNRFYEALPCHLDKDRLYAVTKKRNGTLRFDLIKKKKTTKGI